MQLLNDKVVGKVDLGNSAATFTLWHDVADSVRVYVREENSKADFDKFTGDLSKLLLGGVAKEADEIKEAIFKQVRDAHDTESHDDPVWDQTNCDRLQRVSSVLEAPDAVLCQRIAKLSAAFLTLGKQVLWYMSSKDDTVFSTKLSRETRSILARLVSAKTANAILLADAKPMEVMSLILNSHDDTALELSMKAFMKLGECVANFDT